MKEKNKGRLSKQRFSLKDLIDIKEWQNIQDNFSAVTNINIRTVDPQGDFIISASGETRLCNLLKDSGKKDLICGSCLPEFLGGRGVVDKDLSYVCFKGLHNFIVPIELNGNQVLGYIILGPVILIKLEDKERYVGLTEDLNINLEDLWSAILEIKVVSLHGIRSLVKFIKEIYEYTIKLAYKSKIKEREVVMTLDLSKLSKILDDLLDVAFEISQADIGSMMFLDQSRKNLTILTSKGIPGEIANKTKVRLGEGISGIAAKEGKSFLIDDNLKDNRIRPYLNRPYLGSSMVIPLKVENRVVGVMNLGARKTSSVRFNLDNVQLMNRLVNLVTVAISPAT